MHPRWLRGWRFWVDARPTETPAGVVDRRPFLERLRVIFGFRKEW